MVTQDMPCLLWLCHPWMMIDTGADLSYLGSKEQAPLLCTHRVFKEVTSGRGFLRRQGLEDAP